MTSKRPGIKGWATPPRTARRVFKGRIFSVYQWPQKMFRGRPVTYEAVWRPATVNIVATMGNKLLLTRERQPGVARGAWYYGMPGGRAAEGETPLEGAKRELLEETGCVSDDWSLLSTDQAWPVTRWLVCWYLARNCRRVASQSTHPNEIVKVLKVDLDEFLDKTVSMYGNILTDFAEMKYNRKKRAAFARKALQGGPRGIESTQGAREKIRDSHR